MKAYYVSSYGGAWIVVNAQNKTKARQWYAQDGRGRIGEIREATAGEIAYYSEQIGAVKDGQ